MSDDGFVPLPEALSDDIGEQTQRVLGTDISKLRCLECGRLFGQHGAYITEPPANPGVEARFEGIPHVKGLYCLPSEAVPQDGDTDQRDE